MIVNTLVLRVSDFFLGLLLILIHVHFTSIYTYTEEKGLQVVVQAWGLYAQWLRGWGVIRVFIKISMCSRRCRWTCTYLLVSGVKAVGFKKKKHNKKKHFSNLFFISHSQSLDMALMKECDHRWCTWAVPTPHHEFCLFLFVNISALKTTLLSQIQLRSIWHSFCKTAFTITVGNLAKHNIRICQYASHFLFLRAEERNEQNAVNLYNNGRRLITCVHFCYRLLYNWSFFMIHVGVPWALTSLMTHSEKHNLA